MFVTDGSVGWVIAPEGNDDACGTHGRRRQGDLGMQQEGEHNEYGLDAKISARNQFSMSIK